MGVKIPQLADFRNIVRNDMLIPLIDLDLGNDGSGYATIADITSLLSVVYPTLTGETGVTNNSYPVGHIRRYGGVGDGVTNDTPAALLALAAGTATNKRVFQADSGQWVIKSNLLFPTAYTFKTDGVGRTVFIHRPTANGALLTFSAGVAISYNNTAGAFTVYTDDVTYTKTAVELKDVSSFSFGDINIYGVGAGIANFYSGGAGSIGLRTYGREATMLRNTKIAAERPIVVSANPNTTRSAGEDIDHWNLTGAYLIAKGNPCIEVEAGIGLSNFEVTSVALVGGTDGIKINDTRVAPTILSRNLSFNNIRYEQAEATTAYMFNFTFTSACLDAFYKNCFADATTQGWKHAGAGVLQTVVVNSESAIAGGKDSFNAIGSTAGSTITFLGFYAQPGSVLTLTNFIQTTCGSWNSATTACPAVATYAGVVTGSGVNVAKVRATGAAGASVATFGSGTGDALDIISLAAGSGVSIRSVNNAEGDFQDMRLTFDLFDMFYRTGPAAAASMMSVDVNGRMSMLKKLFLGTDAEAKQTGFGIMAGTGVPNNANGNNGDYYFRGDTPGTANQRLYVRSAGAWVGIV